ncbi:MAG: hypothetical protein PVG17_13050 [Desulfobacterales bacterium]|jgi:hypothetical protein
MAPQRHPFIPLATEVLTTLLARFKSIRANLADDQSTLVQYVCKNEKQLLERLDQAILDVINNPKKTQKTACIGTL